MFYSKGNLRPEKEPLCISVKQHYSVSAFFLLESVVLDMTIFLNQQSQMTC